MKTIVWDNPNKMHFESPHKTFNKQTRCISTGNVIGDTQTSFFIRPYYETECNGFTRPEGYLQNYDLKIFERLPAYIYNQVKDLTKDNGGILYDFHHWQGNKKVTDGYVLTTTKHDFVKVWDINNDYRAQEAVEEAILYITN